MDISRYPAQEPFNPNMAASHDYQIERGKGLNPKEFFYGADPYQSIALFPAPNPDGRVVLFFHGGGWTNGYKEWMFFIAPALNARGISFASAGYRLAPAHLFPSGYQDCVAALDWLGAHAAEHGLDPKQIFVSGHSAGGHYAALMAVSAPGQDGRIRGCAPISGIYYFGEDSGMAVRPRFLGPVEAKAEHAASPIFHVRPGLPPFLLIWGENDFPHLKRQAQEMLAKLKEQNVPVQTLELPGCTHFTAVYAAGDVDGPWAAAIDQWSRGIVSKP
jgi:acetyl esterase/lipase